MGARRKNDFYETPEWATHVLWGSLGYELTQAGRTIVEPCVGDGAIAKVLIENGATVITNDIDTMRPADYHYNASDEWLWASIRSQQLFGKKPDWVVTNPPFNHALEILEMAHLNSNIGVAMLLRLSFLEPTFKRQGFLVKHPPTKLIVLPRISFTGDGKTDSVTCAWMTWEHFGAAQPGGITVIPKAA